MAQKHVAASMVKMSIASVASAGAGAVTLNAAVTGYLTFAAIGDGEECFVMFSLEDGNFNGDANDWVICRCTYTATGTVLSRDEVLASSNSGSDITITTSHVAMVVFPAEQMADNISFHTIAGLEGSTFIGNGAGNTAMTGYDNTLVGHNAGGALTDGPENTCIGADAGDSITTADYCTYLGKDAGKGATVGDSNTATGKDCYGGTATHTGGQNTMSGAFAAQALTSGDGNVLAGYLCGATLSTGRRNSIIGSESDASSGTDYCASVGYRNSHPYDSCLTFGYRITPTATRQCVWGNAAYTTEGDISEFYLNGITASAGTSPTLQACGGSGTNNVGKSLNIAPGKGTGNAAAGNLNFQTSTAGSSGTTLQTLATRGYMSGTDGGLVWGSPTGGSQGAGTINAVGVYDDSALLTDYVFEIYYDGVPVDPEHKDYKIKSLDEEIQHVKDNKHLSTIIGRSEWQSMLDEGIKVSVGDLVSQLWATVETQHLYITELNERLKKLEAE